MRWKSSRVLGFLLLSWLLSAPPVHAEPPSWAEIRSKIFLNFESFSDYRIPGSKYAGGIWAFDPHYLEGQRVRDLDVARYLGWEFPYFGQDLHLETEESLLVMQTWPTELRFDPLSWRLIGRWPTSPNTNLLGIYPPYPQNDMDGEVGWTLRGPILSRKDVRGTGLQPGVFGSPICVYGVLTVNTGWGIPSTRCTGFAPYQGENPVSREDSLLMWSPISPPNAYRARIETHLPYSQNHNGLSWDPVSTGFWFSVESSDENDAVAFFPARSGNILSAERYLNLNINVHPDRYLDLGLVYFDPNSQKIFGWGRKRDRNRLAEDDPVTFLVDIPSGQTVENPLETWLPKFPIIPIPTPGYGEITLKDATPMSATSFREAPEVYEQLIPVVARTEGRHNTRWTTELSFYNPSGEAMSVEIRRLSTDDSRSFVLEAHASRKIESVLSWMGGGEGGDGSHHDALYVSSPWHFGRQLRIDGKIRTPDPETGGFFGHALQAIPAPYGYSNHPQYAESFGRELESIQSPLQLVDSSFQLDERVPGRFRYNIGIVNPYDEELEIVLLWGYLSNRYRLYYYSFPEHYPEAARVLLRIPPKKLRIFDLKSLFPEEFRNTWPARVAVIGNRAAPIWFSMIDEKTQDATFVPYTNYQIPALQYDEEEDWNVAPALFYYDVTHRRAIPVVAHSRGLGNTNWKTTLYGFQAPDPPWYLDSTIGAFYPQGSESCSSGELQLLPGVLPMPEAPWSDYYHNVLEVEGGADTGPPELGFRTVFPDIVHGIHGCEEEEHIQGAMEIVSGSWFAGFSRTFTTRPDGGTYGSMLPPYPPKGWPIQHFAGLEISDAQRINIGFFNGDHEHAIIHRLSLYDESGQLVAEKQFLLDSLDSRQLEIHNLFRGVDLPEGIYGLTVLPLDGVDDEGKRWVGHSWAYVSIVDNLNNDPVNLW